MSEHNDLVDTVHDQTQEILAHDFIRTVRNLSGTEVRCIKVSTILALASAVTTGISSILAFSAGFFEQPYISYAAGCSGVVAMVLMKGSYYASSQSHYHDNKLKNHLTKNYKFLADFVRAPFSLKPVDDPTMPDAMTLMARAPENQAQVLEVVVDGSPPPKIES